MSQMKAVTFNLAVETEAGLDAASYVMGLPKSTLYRVAAEFVARRAREKYGERFERALEARKRFGIGFAEQMASAALSVDASSPASSGEPPLPTEDPQAA